MKKQLAHFFFFVFFPLLVVLTVMIFVINTGMDTKFFIKNDFTQAFSYWRTGDCDAFASYVYPKTTADVASWKESCEENKGDDTDKIQYMKIHQLSHKVGSDRAFLQVEVRWAYLGGDYTKYLLFEMKQINGIWKISNEKNL